MAGPWENYAPASGGPWTKYGPEDRTDRAVQRGFARSASFGFLDELEGLARAGGASPDEDDPLKTIWSLGVGAYRKIKGDPEAQKAYDEQLARSRQFSKELEEQHPVASTAGQVGGAVALPVAAAAKTATMAGRAMAGAKTGAVVGGLTGFGEGEGLEGSVKGAAIGAPLGAGVGAAAPYVVEPVVRAARFAASPITNRIMGAVRPTAAAEREIGAAALAGQNANRMGLTGPEFAAERAAGTPVANVDLLGQEGLSLARKAANLSPTALGQLQEASQRSQQVGGRLSNWMKGQLHYGEPAASQEALERAARNVNPVAYRRAAQEAAQLHPGGLWDEGFEQISQAPVVQDAIRKASITGGNQAAREGFTPVGNPFGLDRATGRMTLEDDAPRPTLAFWDEVKKNLDKVGTRDARDFSRVLRERIDELVPSYGEARAGAAAFFGARDMLQAGQSAVNAAGKFKLPEMRRVLAKATDEERKLFNDGYAGRMAEMLDAKGGAARTTMLNRIRDSAAAREELELGLGGRAQAEEFMARMRVESIMDRLRTALGNSTTVRQYIESGLFTTGGGLLTFADPDSWTSTAGLALALRGGARFVNIRLANRLAEMLTSNDPAIVEQAIRRVSSNTRLMRALEEADNWTVKNLSSRSPGAVQAGAAGSAEENQPQVPGPPQ